MGARRGGGPAITLFSFQDIITSVSGILIFITLLLSVELVERLQHAESNPAKHSAFELQNAIAQAEAERNALQRLISEPSTATGSSLKAEREFHEAVDQVALTEQELLEVDRTLDEARARVAEARTRMTGSHEQQEAYRRQVAEVQSLKAQLRKERRGDRVYFQRSSEIGSIREGWIVLLDGHTVSLAPIDRPARPRSFLGPVPARDADKIDPTSQALLDWVQRQAPGAYLLLVARPSGLRRVHPLEDELHRRGWRYGLELVAEHQEVLDPEKGVYRP